jgi:RimJ/RimL family protein N-acetyltransferase
LIVETDRLKLRCMEPKDIDDFVRDLGDWEVQQWLALPPFPYERKDGEAFLAIVRNNHATPCPTVFVIADKASDVALGTVAIDIDGEGNGVLGYWLGRDHWGHGYAKEAVAALLRHAQGHPTLRHLSAVTDLENIRSQHVLATCGLVDCGLRDRTPPSRRGSTRLRRYELAIKGL